MRDAAFALCWLMLLPISLYSAYIGVLIWIWVAIFSPNDLLFGFMRDVAFNKVIAVVTFGVLIFSQEKKDFYVDKIVVALLLFALVGTVSALGSFVDTDDGWTLYFKLLKELTLAFLILGVITSRFRMHMAVFTMCIAFGYEGVVESAGYVLTAGGHKITGMASVGDNNSLAVEILMSIPLLWYLFQYSAAKYMRTVLGIVTAMSIVTVIVTFSRGGFIGLIVLGLFMVARSRNKFGGFLMVATVGTLLYAFAPANYSDRVNSIDDINADSSVLARVNAWKVSLAVALDNPLTGGGFHAVQRVEVWSRYKPAAEAITFPETPPIDNFARAAHSIYFEVLGDLGFTGLFVFGLIILFALRNTSQVRKLARLHPSQAWAGDLAQMMQISIILYCVCGAALSMAYWEGFYIFVALTSRLQRTVLQAIAAEEAGETPLPSRFGLAGVAASPVAAGAGAGAWRR
jgi:probable O-glycosylation ligase (exosortase A-associated)